MQELFFNYHFETTSGAHPKYCQNGTVAVACGNRGKTARGGS
jgi:hypothetical protein